MGSEGNTLIRFFEEGTGGGCNRFLPFHPTCVAAVAMTVIVIGAEHKGETQDVTAEDSWPCTLKPGGVPWISGQPCVTGDPPLVS